MGKYRYIKATSNRKTSKKTLAVFLIGLILGVYLSKFTYINPATILQTPVNLSMAQTKNLVLPIAEGEVLGAMDLPQVTPGGFGEILVQENIDTVIPSATPSATPQVAIKTGSLTIAFLGDSMVDTMGEGLPYIEKELKKDYPGFQFNLLNYGAGGTNIEYGIQRITQDYEYLGKKIPALVKTNPDIVVVESFAYNPWGADQSDLDRHWLAMAKIVDLLKSQTNAKILFLATIAPNKANFGVGPGGVNWDKDISYLHAAKIEKYIDNTIKFAKSQGYAYIDAYTPSIVSGDGNLTYINPGDHIHPSVLGCQFIARLIALKLTSLGWI